MKKHFKEYLILVMLFSFIAGWKTSRWFLNHTINFQSPIKINRRDIKNTKKQAKTGANLRDNKKEVYRHTKKINIFFSDFSVRAAEHIKQNPQIARKLIDAFQNKLIVELVSKESSLNPQAINPKSGACGLFQANPCKKMDCSLDDIDCQIEWGKNYIEKRYGSVEKAYKFHNQHGWY